MMKEKNKELYSNINLNDEEYLECVKDLINNEVVLSMDNYMQHGNTSCLAHCKAVSYYSFKLAKKYNLDEKSTARAALLHDLFLYDWHKQSKQKLFKKHGFTHPQKALDNATKYFNLNDIERDIIIKHMWPLTFRHIPKYKESIIVTMVDKYCSTIETFEPLFNRKKKSIFSPKKQY